MNLITSIEIDSFTNTCHNHFMDPQNIPLQPQPPQPTGSIVPQSNKLFLISLIIGSITILCIGLIGGFYLAKRQFVVKNIKPSVIPSLISIPTQVTQVETTNWKTYVKDFQDLKGLYPTVQFQYPADWTYTKQSMEGTADQRLTFKGQNGTVAIVVNISVLDFVQLFHQTANSWGQGSLTLSNIGTNSAYHFQNSNSYVDAYFFPQPTGYVSIQLLDKNYQNIYNQILSTFKFLSQSQSVSGLQTYFNKFYGFTFQYPSNAQLLEIPKDSDKMNTLGYIPLCDSQKGIVCVYFSPDNYYKTNFQGAALSVTTLKELTNETDCLSGSQTLPDGMQNPVIVTINNVKFVKGVEMGGGAALGNYQDNIAYHTWRTNLCLGIRENIDTFTYENVTNGSISRFTQDNENAMFSTLDKIVSSFNFVNSYF